MATQTENDIARLVIDLVHSATDGYVQLTRASFSHFDEDLPEWTALIDYVKAKGEKV